MELTLDDLWQKYKDGERDFEYVTIIDPTGLGLSGKLLYAINLKGSTLHGLKLSNIDFTEADFTEADLTGCNLQGCKLIQVNLSKAIFRKVNLRSATLHLVNFNGAILDQCIYDTETHFSPDFNPQTVNTYLIAPNANLVGADLSNTDLKGAKLQGANLENADLSNTILTGNVNLNNANLQGANLTHVVMTKAILTKANLKNACLQEADLTEVDFTEANLNNANLSKACVTFTVFYRANLEGANLEKIWVKRWGPDFSEANLQKANLEAANLGEQAELIDTRLNYANLRKIKLWRADLSDADLTGADLREANFKETNLARAILDQTRIEGANFHKTNLIGTILEDTIENPRLNQSFPVIATDQDIYYHEEKPTPVKTWKDINFYSESELRIAQTLDQLHITFFTNCQGINPKNSENSQSVSFLVFYQGKWGILQVKQKGWLEEAKEHNPLVIPGIKVIEYYDDHLCFQQPTFVVNNFLEILAKSD